MRCERSHRIISFLRLFPGVLAWANGECDVAEFPFAPLRDLPPAESFSGHSQVARPRRVVRGEHALVLVGSYPLLTSLFRRESRQHALSFDFVGVIFQSAADGPGAP
jgi:hypothetical protein